MSFSNKKITPADIANVSQNLNGFINFNPR